MSSPPVTVPFAVGDLVNVQDRRWSGVNKAGGVARVTGLKLTRGGGDATYTVKFVIGNREECGVQTAYLSRCSLLDETREGGGRRRRRDIKAPMHFDEAYDALEERQKTRAKKEPAAPRPEKLTGLAKYLDRQLNAVDDLLEGLGKRDTKKYFAEGDPIVKARRFDETAAGNAAQQAAAAVRGATLHGPHAVAAAVLQANAAAHLAQATAVATAAAAAASEFEGPPNACPINISELWRRHEEDAYVPAAGSAPPFAKKAAASAMAAGNGAAVKPKKGAAAAAAAAATAPAGGGAAGRGDGGGSGAPVTQEKGGENNEDNDSLLLPEGDWRFSLAAMPRWDALSADIEGMLERVASASAAAAPAAGGCGGAHMAAMGAAARDLLAWARAELAALRDADAPSAADAAIEELLLPALAANAHSCVQGAWREQPFPLRRYRRYLEAYAPGPDLRPVDAARTLAELETDLPDGYLGAGGSYAYDDGGAHEVWMWKGGKREKEDVLAMEGAAAATSILEADAVRAQVSAVLTTAVQVVVDRINNDHGVLQRPPLALCRELREAAVWGLDSYTRVNVEVVLEKLLGWPRERADRFVELVLLPTVNALEGIEGSTAMEAALQALRDGLNGGGDGSSHGNAGGGSTVGGDAGGGGDDGGGCGSFGGIGSFSGMNGGGSNGGNGVGVHSGSMIPGCGGGQMHGGIVMNGGRGMRDGGGSVNAVGALNAGIGSNGGRVVGRDGSSAGAAAAAVLAAAGDGGRGARRAAAALLRAMQILDRDHFHCHPKGTGVVCVAPEGLPANTFVSEYLGELYPAWRWSQKLEAVEDAQRRYGLKPTLPDFYNMTLERPRDDRRGYGTVFIEAGGGAANLSSSLSHSCDANCTTAVAVRGGRLTVVLTTTRDVAPGEELTMDYHSVTTSEDEFHAAVCLCGRGSCRGSFMHFTGAHAYQMVLRNFGPLMTFRSLLHASAAKAKSKAAAAATAVAAVTAGGGDGSSSCGNGSGGGSSTNSDGGGIGGSGGSGAAVATVDEDGDDEAVLARHGVGAAALGRQTPGWLRRFVADQLRYVEYERQKVPSALMRMDPEELDGYRYTHRAADGEARAIMEQRVQSLVRACDVVYYLLRQQRGDGGASAAGAAVTRPGGGSGAGSDAGGDNSSVAADSGDDDGGGGGGGRSAKFESENLVGGGDAENEDGDASVAEQPPPLRLVEPDELIAVLWSSKGSAARRLVRRLDKLFEKPDNLLPDGPAGNPGSGGSGGGGGSSSVYSRPRWGNGVHSSGGSLGSTRSGSHCVPNQQLVAVRPKRPNAGRHQGHEEDEAWAQLPEGQLGGLGLPPKYAKRSGVAAKHKGKAKGKGKGKGAASAGGSSGGGSSASGFGGGSGGGGARARGAAAKEAVSAAITAQELSEIENSGEPDDPISCWDPDACVKLTGANAPRRKNLRRAMQQRPNLELYTGQAKMAAKKKGGLIVSTGGGGGGKNG
ncbi:unnamed protein product, partial [Phaeothamnion confervicola]